MSMKISKRFMSLIQSVASPILPSELAPSYKALVLDVHGTQQSNSLGKLDGPQVEIRQPLPSIKGLE